MISRIKDSCIGNMEVTIIPAEDDTSCSLKDVSLSRFLQTEL